jgi:putative transposase
MPQSLSKVYVHIIFSTKNRQNLIDDRIENSLKWIKTKGQAYSNFYWQDGYGIFSINHTETDKVIDYIQLQQEHHKHKSFRDEFIAFLKRYQVEYDERYLWD